RHYRRLSRVTGLVPLSSRQSRLKQRAAAPSIVTCRLNNPNGSGSSHTSLCKPVHSDLSVGYSAAVRSCASTILTLATFHSVGRGILSSSRLKTAFTSLGFTRVTS